MQALFIIGGTVFCWVLGLGFLFLLRLLPGNLFLPLHYILHVFIFGTLAYILRRGGVQYAAWSLAVIVACVLTALGLFYWEFVNPTHAGEFLTVPHWLTPIFIAALAVYLIALFTRAR